MKVKIVLKNGHGIITWLPIKSLYEISRQIKKDRCKWIYTGELLISVSEISYIREVK